jgi:hypothetical protein
MTDAFSAGLAPEQDYALTGSFPDDPGVAETMNFWAYDAERDIELNLHPQIKDGAMAGGATLFLPGGKILRRRHDDPGRVTDGAAPSSAHISYRCIEPFHRWAYTVDNLPAFATSDSDQAHGIVADEAPVTAFSVDFESECAAPAWYNGTLTTEARHGMEGPAGLWIAARTSKGMHPDCFRYDQLVRVTGKVRAGDEVMDFNGVGLRCHVRGSRDLNGMAGTCWMSGLFPSGRGFGVLVNIGDDGRYLFSEAHITDGKHLEPARILQFPRTHRDLNEGKYWLQLATDAHGMIDIEGEDIRAFYWSMPEWGAPAAGIPPVYARDGNAGVLMKQAIARYVWDGETGYGHDERSG